MSKVKRYTGATSGGVEEAIDGELIEFSEWESAQFEITSLRNDLITAKRNEHNSEVAYKAAIEKQAELRADADQFRESSAQLASDLLAAEQRNANLVSAIENHLKGTGESPGAIRRYAELRDALKPTESGASE